jgi:hypothetical protein
MKESYKSSARIVSTSGGMSNHDSTKLSSTDSIVNGGDTKNKNHNEQYHLRSNGRSLSESSHGQNYLDEDCYSRHTEDDYKHNNHRRRILHQNISTTSASTPKNNNRSIDMLRNASKTGADHDDADSDISINFSPSIFDDPSTSSNNKKKIGPAPRILNSSDNL